MAYRSKTFCKHPGCANLCKGGYCEEHRAQHEAELEERNRRYNRSRGSAASQGYDARWQKARLAYLRQHPICERCEVDGRVTAATLVHHIVELKDGGARLDHDNLMALCNDCHEQIHGPDRWRRRG